MNVTKHELLSALLDDEAGDFERRRLLNELKQDDELVETWGRYALVGDVLRNRHTAIKKRDFLAGIHAAIEEEKETSVRVATTAIAQPSVPKVTSIWRTVAQYGAAASVGAVIMAAGFMLNRADTVVPTDIAVNSPVLSQPLAFHDTVEPVVLPVKMARPISRLDPKTQAILRSYIKDHIRYASTTSVVPTVRAVSYNQ